MKIKQLLVSLAALCAMATEEGCVLRSRWESQQFVRSTEHFPLTLTLSLREREQQTADLFLADGRWANSGTGVIEKRWTILPLPKGEGRGEGEPSVAYPTVQSVRANRPLSQYSFDGTNLNRDGGQFSAEFSQRVNLNQLAFQEPDLATKGAGTSDEWQRFDTNAGARENFGALDERGDGRINLTEFLKQATNHSRRYHFFADTDKTNEGYVSWDKELFRQPGWQLFSIRF